MEETEYLELTPQAVADAVREFFGVEIAPRAADDAIRDHAIGFFKLGRARLTNRTELAAWIESCRVPPGSPYRKASEPKLSEYDVRAIRRDYESGASSVIDLARNYGVNRSTIYKVLSGTIYQQVEPAPQQAQPV